MFGAHHVSGARHQVRSESGRFIADNFFQHSLEEIVPEPGRCIGQHTRGAKLQRQLELLFDSVAELV